jgi:hypothetical protein
LSFSIWRACGTMPNTRLIEHHVYRFAWRRQHIRVVGQPACRTLYLGLGRGGLGFFNAFLLLGSETKPTVTPRTSAFASGAPETVAKAVSENRKASIFFMTTTPDCPG